MTSGKSPGLRTGATDGVSESVGKIPFKLPKWRRQLLTWRHARKKTVTSLAGNGAAHATDKIPA